MSMLCDVIARTSCFELVNDGISNQLVRYVSSYGAGIFELSPEKKAVMFRSGDRMYGFVEFYGEKKETCEEFVWCRDDTFRTKLDAVSSLPISNFRLLLIICSLIILIDNSLFFNLWQISIWGKCEGVGLWFYIGGKDNWINK
ncbi:hypothetical protein HanIR_Chr04g0155671 [Helianthus annuus]|nr:hypothetical protein HanIR_Chr04g0155671 [Helianthus annuus]